MNVSIITVVPWRDAVQSPFIASDFIARVHGPRFALAMTILVLIIALACGGTYVVMNMQGLFAAPPSLLVHMNLAFYLLVSTVLFVVWFAVVSAGSYGSSRAS